MDSQSESVIVNAVFYNHSEPHRAGDTFIGCLALAILMGILLALMAVRKIKG